MPELLRDFDTLCRFLFGGLFFADPGCETSGSQEALQNKEARQQGLWRLHVRQECA